jgi:hypothetical protein
MSSNHGSGKITYNMVHNTLLRLLAGFVNRLGHRFSYRRSIRRGKLGRMLSAG